jgi:hypothetical protein
MNRSQFHISVIPAKAGIHSTQRQTSVPQFELHNQWIPAFAGMTMFGEQRNAA